MSTPTNPYDLKKQILASLEALQAKNNALKLALRQTQVDIMRTKVALHDTENLILQDKLEKKKALQDISVVKDVNINAP